MALVDPARRTNGRRFAGILAARPIGAPLQDQPDIAADEAADEAEARLPQLHRVPLAALTAAVAPLLLGIDAAQATDGAYGILEGRTVAVGPSGLAWRLEVAVPLPKRLCPCTAFALLPSSEPTCLAL